MPHPSPPPIFLGSGLGGERRGGRPVFPPVVDDDESVPFSPPPSLLQPLSFLQTFSPPLPYVGEERLKRTFFHFPSKQQPVTTSKSPFFRRPPLSLPPIVSQRRLLVFYRPKLSTKCAVLFIPFPTRRPHSPLQKTPFFLAEGDDVIMTLFSPPLSSHQPPPQ